MRDSGGKNHDCYICSEHDFLSNLVTEQLPD